MNSKTTNSELIGKTVMYIKSEPQEEGVITSYNDSYVYVKFGNDKHSKACYYEDLELIVDVL